MLDGAGDGAAATLVSEVGAAEELWLTGLDSGAAGCGATEVFLAGLAGAELAAGVGLGATVVLDEASFDTVLLGLELGLE